MILTDLQLTRHHDDVTFDGVVSIAVCEDESHILSKLVRSTVLAVIKLTLYTHSDAQLQCAAIKKTPLNKHYAVWKILKIL